MEDIKRAFYDVLEQLGCDSEVEFSFPDSQFGDLSTNIAMRLSKKLSKAPREIASEIVSMISSPAIKSVEVAGPGFINITMTDSSLINLSALDKIDSKSGKVVIETNNPNPFKAMHIGHAYNGIIPDTLANLLEFGGYEVHRVSYHGDVGMHVGRAMHSLLDYVDGKPERLQEVPAGERNSFMSKMYAKGSAKYKDDVKAKAKIEELAKQSFTLSDSLYKEVYEICKGWSFEEIDKIISVIGNKPVERRYLESETDRVGLQIVQENVGTVFIESDGALVFPGKKYGSFDNAFVSSAGKTLYGARDLGLIQLKGQDFSPDFSYIVTAEEQKDYFKGVIKAAELAMPEVKTKTINIPTGTVKLSTGKMKSRDGNVIEVQWLFERVAEATKARGGSTSQEIIRAALRYEFLKIKIGSDVIFDVDQSVSMNGNSGPYLQYAYARACSILAKADVEGDSYDEGTELELENQERELVRKLSQWQVVASEAVDQLAPHSVCSYLFELAQIFNRFYENNRVVGSERQSLRLKIVRLYAKRLKVGLDLLGMDALEIM
jgi:arginyl-tRNA synthetase